MNPYTLKKIGSTFGVLSLVIFLFLSSYQTIQLSNRVNDLDKQLLQNKESFSDLSENYIILSEEYEDLKNDLESSQEETRRYTGNPFSTELWTGQLQSENITGMHWYSYDGGSLKNVTEWVLNQVANMDLRMNSSSIYNASWLNSTNLLVTNIYGSAGLMAFNYTSAVEDAVAGLGPRNFINFIQGANITLTVTDDAAGDRINVTIAATGETGPAGPITRKGFDYVIFYNASANTYDGINGSSGVTDYSNANPDITIENVWSALSSGGKFCTVGPNQNWTLNSEINSQASYVTWVNSVNWIVAKESLNSHMIDIDTHDRIILDGLRLDGNFSSQTTGNCIYMTGSDYSVIKNCDLFNAMNYSVQLESCSNAYLDNLYVSGVGTDDGISIGSGCVYASVQECFVTRVGGNGFSAYNADITAFTNCISNDNDDQLYLGDLATQNGFHSISSNRTSYINCRAIANSGQGFIVSSPLDWDVYSTLIGTYSMSNGEHGVQIYAGNFSKVIGGFFLLNSHPDIEVYNGSNCIVSEVYVNGTQICINAETAENLIITDSILITSSTGIDINNAAVVNPFIDGVNFDNCNVDISAGAATNAGYGTNLNGTAVWVHNTEP